MLKDMGREKVGGTLVRRDIYGSIALASNAGYHALTNRVDTRHPIIREIVKRGSLKVDSLIRSINWRTYLPRDSK